MPLIIARIAIVFRTVAVSLLITGLATAALHPDQPVKTQDGPISGVLSKDGRVMIFRGIPYAAPPVGPLRWRPPQPVKKWTGVLKADHFSRNCVQPLVRELLPWTHEFMLGNDVSEDCLYLNIWAGTSIPEKGLPVYIYIHGGAFTGGSGDVSVYNGEHLARRGLIVVTLNYRLGVLGFLSHPELSRESPHNASGNYGLLDQLAAIRWVAENIRAFGGNPKQITIGGQSAGAISVNLLVASPLAKDLFQGAVAESGSGVTSAPIQALSEAEKTGEQYAASMGAKSVADLRAIPWQELEKNHSKAGKGLHFTPVIDGWLLPRAPNDAFEGHDWSDVPTMTGWNADDSFGRPQTAQRFREQASRRYGSFASEFLRLYPAGSDEQALASYKAASRDRNRVSMYLWAKRRAKAAKTPAFTYFFTRAIPWPEHPEFGAFHTAEVPYIFDNLNRLPRPWQPKDHEVANVLSSYLVNFAGSGNPNGSNLPHWPAFDPAKQTTMEIGNEMEPISIAPPGKVEFWIRYLSSPESSREPFL